MDAGEDARTVQYSIVRGRTPGLRWYLRVGFAVRGANAVGTAGSARVLHGGKGMEASSSSSQVMPAGTSEVVAVFRAWIKERRCGGGLSILTLSLLWLSMRTAAVFKIRVIGGTRVTSMTGGVCTRRSGSYDEWIYRMCLRLAWIGIGRLRRVPRNGVSRQIAGAMRALLPRGRWLIWSQTVLRWGRMVARAVLRSVSTALRSPSARSGRGAVGARCDEAASKSRGKEVREEAVETDTTKFRVARAPSSLAALLMLMLRATMLWQIRLRGRACAQGTLVGTMFLIKRC